jgi:hypothetical protein
MSKVNCKDCSQEDCAYFGMNNKTNCKDFVLKVQPSKQWVELTEDEIKLFINGHGDEDDDNYVEPTGDGFGVTDSDLVKLVRRAEAKLKEKNSD